MKEKDELENEQQQEEVEEKEQVDDGDELMWMMRRMKE